jgi:hypothetical protein
MGKVLSNMVLMSGKKSRLLLCNNGPEHEFISIRGKYTDEGERERQNSHHDDDHSAFSVDKRTF